MNPVIIACDIHDHVEIICMRRYEVVLHLLNGSLVQGLAKNTRSSAAEEFLLLEQQGEQLEVPLLQIQYIEVLTAGAPLAQIWLHPAGSCAM
ncbi:Rho-binding antiterminator [Rheinheimera riviphila]|nr:Rho-binding antiterminator [Rheinheimera riviphila]